MFGLYLVVTGVGVMSIIMLMRASSRITDKASELMAADSGNQLADAMTSMMAAQVGLSWGHARLCSVRATLYHTAVLSALTAEKEEGRHDGGLSIFGAARWRWPAASRADRLGMSAILNQFQSQNVAKFAVKFSCTGGCK